MTEIKGKILLSYDIDDDSGEVENTLINQYRYFSVDLDILENKVYYYPNRTLYHKYKQVSTAIKDIQDICKKHNVTLEKAIAVLVSETANYNRKPF